MDSTDVFFFVCDKYSVLLIQSQALFMVVD